MTKQRERVIWLVIGAVGYLLAWYFAAQSWRWLHEERGELVASAPFLFCVVLLIVEVGKWEEGDTT